MRTSFLFGYKQFRHSAKFSFDAVPMILYDAISELVHHGIDEEGKMRFYPLFPYSFIFLVNVNEYLSQVGTNI